MKKIKVLHVIFDNHFEPYNVIALRAAIAKNIAKNKLLFHHHIDDNRRLFRYPLAQFKIINNKAHIYCIEDACEPMMEFLSSNKYDIEIGSNKIKLSVFNVSLKHINIQVWDKALTYRINKWLALNPDNYRKYLAIESLAERVMFLEKILTAHIIAFAEGIKFDIQSPLKVSIHHIYKEYLTTYRDVKLHAFDLKFSVNMTIPPYVGIGKAVSVGNGIVKREHNPANAFNQKNRKEKTQLIESNEL